MTVAINTEAVKQYTGNGTASVFSIPFPTFEASNVEAEVYNEATGESTELSLNTHFTLSNIGKPGTLASLTLINDAGFAWLITGKLKTGFQLFIKFDSDAAQPMRGRDWGGFSPEKFELTLDRLAMNVKAVKALADKAIQIDLGSGANVKLPSFLGMAGKIVQVNEDEDGFEYGVTSDQIQDWRNETQTFRNDAEDYRNTAVAAADDAEDYKIAAENASTNANNQAASANNHKTDAQNAATGAASSAGQAQTAVADANTAKNLAVTAKTQAEAAAAIAVAAANDTSVVAGYKTATEAARDVTLGYRDQTEDYRDEALGFRNEAVSAVNDAETAMLASETAMGFAELFKDDAETAKDQAELFANLSSFSKKLTITVADSPFTVDDDTHADTLIIVDDSGGNVVINMPPVSDTNDQPLWKIGFMKKSGSANQFTVNRAGLDTIGGGTSIVVNDQYLGLLLYPGSPTNWTAKYFVYAVAADGFVLSGSALHFGDAGVDGTWRIAQVGTQLKFQQRILGVWTDSDVMNPPV